MLDAGKKSPRLFDGFCLRQRRILDGPRTNFSTGKRSVAAGPESRVSKSFRAAFDTGTTDRFTRLTFQSFWTLDFFCFFEVFIIVFYMLQISTLAEYGHWCGDTKENWKPNVSVHVEPERSSYEATLDRPRWLSKHNNTIKRRFAQWPSAAVSFAIATAIRGFWKREPLLGKLIDSTRQSKIVKSTA